MLVVGLGNPGERYARTRHNIGYRWVDALAATAGGAAWKSRYKGLFAEVRLADRKIALLKPETFMNASGESIQAAMAGLRVRPDDLWVGHDELDLAFGTLRIKVGGGAAGHNGLKSIIASIGSGPFVRLRFGIGHPGKEADVVGYVLGRHAPEEESRLPDLFAAATHALTTALRDGIERATQTLHTAARA